MSDDRAPDVSPSVERAMRRLWHPPAQGRRGPKAALSVRAIVDAAVTLADAEGLHAVSMARVADQLGCTATALYRHVDNKDELLALLADRVAAEAPPLPEGLGWRDGLRLWTQVQIEGVLAHPWVLELPLASTPLGPHRARWIDRGFGVMRDLDLPMHEKGQILSLLSEHVLGQSRVRADLNEATSNPFADLGRTIRGLADEHDLPDLFAAFCAEQPSDATDDSFGIDVILEGVEARRRRRQRQRRP